jgi:deazaflavin-dependent oxidoreductase (nitroreductase family)
MWHLEQLVYRHERWMYASGHPNRLASLLNRGWAAIGSTRLGRQRLVTIEVAGRRSGRPVVVPLIAADLDGERYLVSMLGERAGWVANVRAAGGQIAIRGAGRRTAVRVEEVPPERRAAIIRRHLELAPAARSFIAVDRRAPVAAFEAVAPSVPVFRLPKA